MNFFLKTICILSMFLLITSLIEKDENKLKTGFYYLAEKEEGSELIKDVEEDKIFAIEKKEVLTVDDFSDAKFVVRNFKPNAIKVIELKLTKVGRKKWSEIKKRISSTGESIVFVCNDKIYLEKTILVNNNSESSTIDLLIDPKYQEEVIQVIKSEIKNNH